MSYADDRDTLILFLQGDSLGLQPIAVSNVRENVYRVDYGPDAPGLYVGCFEDEPMPDTDEVTELLEMDSILKRRLARAGDSDDVSLRDLKDIVAERRQLMNAVAKLRKPSNAEIDEEGAGKLANLRGGTIWED